MPVKLRLHRMGKKKQPFYRIVAVDSRDRRDGMYLEKVGHYNPIVNPAEVVIDREKALKWLNRGAVPTDTVRSFLRRQGILLEWDLRRKGLDDEKVTEELKKWEVLQLERQKKLEAKAAMETRKTDVKEEKAEATSEAPVEEKAEEAPVQEAEVAAEEQTAETETEEVQPSAEEPAEPVAEEKSQESKETPESEEAS